MKYLKRQTSKKRQNGLISENKKPWFYDKHGNVCYVRSSPTTIDGKVIIQEPKTYFGSLNDSVGFCMRSNKINNHLNSTK